MEWVSSGASAKVGYYMPQRLALGASKPAGLEKMPEGVAAPIYGELTLGTKESPQKFIVLIDELADGKQRLWLDANANGDLTDDPPVKWLPRTSSSSSRPSTTYFADATVTVAYGAATRELSLSFYRFDPKTRADAKSMMLYYRNYARVGEVELGQKTYRAILDDAKATGDFRSDAADSKSSSVHLLVDVNGDGKFDSRGERFDVHKPFNVGGTTYEITGLTAAGEFQIVKSSKTVEESKPLPSLVVGGKPLSFTATTTAGNPVKFPDDYKDKVVLLDFWATWCGPCRAELPNLKAVYKEFHEQGFEVLGVSLDNETSIKKLDQFVKDNGITWPQIADGKWWEAEVARLYNVRSIPTCILVNGRTGLITALTGEARGTMLRASVAAAFGKGATGTAKAAGVSLRESPEPEHAAVPDPLLARAEAALKAGRLMSVEKFLEARQQPAGGALALPVPARRELSGREIARVARESYLRVGWYYQCTRCDKWHTKVAGGYAVAPDAIVTAWHVMTPPATMKMGHVLAADSAGQVLGVSGVVAADERMDAIVLRMAGGKLKPLALGTAEVGDAAFCFSDPLKQRNYFSAGIVNRYRVRNDDGSLPVDSASPADLRVNVSTDWGPGSSGAAVLDVSGNVIGHVATITSLKGTNTTAYMTMHDAVPAKSVLSLMRSGAAAAR